MKLLFLILPLVLCRLGAATFICRTAKSTLLAEVSAIASPRDGSALGIRHRHARRTVTALFAEKKVAALVSGEELEKMLADLDQPLVVDAYATWYVDVKRVVPRNASVNPSRQEPGNGRTWQPL
jgi:hypothetical protein